jgi:phosphatidate cytidylyltransferase
MKNSEFYKRILSSITLIPIIILLLIKGSIFLNVFLLLCFFISLYEWHKISKNSNYYLLGIFFIILSFYSFFVLRNNFDTGFLYVGIILLICILTDIGGYFFGKIIKGPKLTKISPKKTISGMIGSFILPLFTVKFISNFNFFPSILTEFSSFFFILLISAISQIGDLIISYFKRNSNIKDTGNFIPGHGGLLDRIDGIIFVFPFFYLYLKFNLFDIF